MHTEQGICLECHRTVTFRWHSDGPTLRGVGATRIVVAEPDAKDPAVLWLTLQAKCRCGATLGWCVEHREVEVSAAAERSAPAPTDTGRATAAADAAPPPRDA